jgi:hypothetical protein
MGPRRLPAILATFAAVATGLGYQVYEDKGKEKLPPGENVLWTDPGDPSSLDFQYGIGGAERQPQPPFRFVSEDLLGTSPKVNVTDARGAAWNVKWGHEGHSSTFCTRLLWACGYYVEPEYFVAQGRIEGAHGLKRAGSRISNDGSFEAARFQLRSGSAKFLDGYAWTWIDNPFLRTPEFQGLKILMLLVSNWDAKDARDRVPAPNGRLRTDSNLMIFLDDSTDERNYLFSQDDWGASLGKWGNVFTWKKWNCKGFADQTPHFVKRAENGQLRWGFEGKHRKDLTDITVSDVQWLLKYLGQITDAQIRIGLEASGATPEETECYAQALRQRIQQLQQVAADVPAPATQVQKH